MTLRQDTPIYALASYVEGLEAQVDTYQQSDIKMSKQIVELNLKIIELNQQIASMVYPKETWEVNADKIIAAGLVLDALGIPYVFGGETFKGMDCSGYTQFLYKLVGISLPRTSKDQAKVGQEISKDNMTLWRKGDLLIFSYDKDEIPDHVAIYMGDGNMLHTNTPSTGINIKKVISTSLVSVRRVL
jgi:cell wall-associated NlpC family hydrolase